jgi:hypothetical protein
MQKGQAICRYRMFGVDAKVCNYRFLNGSSWHPFFMAQVAKYLGLNLNLITTELSLFNRIPTFAPDELNYFLKIDRIIKF